MHLPFRLDVVHDMVHFYGNFIGKNCDSGNEGGNDTGYCVWTKWMAMAMTMVIAQKCPVWFGSILTIKASMVGLWLCERKIF